MSNTKLFVLCNCGKQVTSIKPESYTTTYGMKYFEQLKNKLLNEGYILYTGTPPRDEVCVEPCSDRINCAFKKNFTLEHGRHEIL